MRKTSCILNFSVVHYEDTEVMAIMSTQENATQTANTPNAELPAAQGIDMLAVLEQAMRLPGVRIDREQFLSKELGRKYPKVIIQRAIDNNPAYARIERYDIDKIAKHVIDYECNKTTALSVAAGLPGGIVGIAGMPADILQYFMFMLRVIQKLAYLYGFEDFHLSEEHVDDELMNKIMVFIGVMFGAQEANVAIKIVAKAAGEGVAKKLARQALMKNGFYRGVKKLAPWLGIQMNKKIFANGVGRAIPVVGGLFAGGLTYATFKPCANNLKNALREQPICDPKFYRSGKYLEENEDPVIPDAEEVVFYSIDPDEGEVTDENVNDSQTTPQQYTS